MSITVKSLTDKVSVSPQVMLSDAEALKEAGFKSVINNRPDSEMPGQPLSVELEASLKEQGIELRHVPMPPGELSLELIENMAAALADLPKPVLSFCASGTRSTILWCCVNAKTEGVDTVLSKAADAGYNLEQFRSMLTQLSK